MTSLQSKLIRLWHEVKRRKVFRVLVTYAATAYIILVIVNYLIQPLHLPAWTTTLVIILLALGLPLVLIFTWIFDITPEGIKKTEALDESELDSAGEPALRRRLKPSDVVIAVLIITVVVLAWPKIFRHDSIDNFRSSDGKISIAVLPFQNMTSDTIWDIWQNGIQNELIASLTNSEELKVRQTETVDRILVSRGITNYAALIPSVASDVSQKLEANVLINGNISQAGNQVRLNAQLIDAKRQEVIKSFQIESAAREEMIFNIIDSLSRQIKSFLIIAQMQLDSPYDLRNVKPTNSPEAYRYFMYGQKAFNTGDLKTAINYYVQALSIDSSFYSAITMLSVSYYNMGMYDQAKKWCLKIYEKRDQMSVLQNIHVNWQYSLLFETPMEEIKYLLQLIEIDDQNPAIYYELGRIYVGIEQYDNAISSMKKVFEIYKKWESKPRWVQDYNVLGFAYQKTLRYKKEKRLFRKAEKEFPNNMYLLQRQAILSLSENDTIAANRYLDDLKSLLEENSASDADIFSSLAYAYTEGNYLDKAEECYRKGLALNPEHPSLLNNLGWFLIKNDRNIEEGMILVDSALKIRPNSYLYMENKGLGLYKQGKYDESLKILESAWKLRPVYNYSSFVLLEKVKKAASGQQNIYN
jgi:tetratricopeptide (TPR) repeat protein